MNPARLRTRHRPCVWLPPLCAPRQSIITARASHWALGRWRAASPSLPSPSLRRASIRRPTPASEDDVTLGPFCWPLGPCNTPPRVGCAGYCTCSQGVLLATARAPQGPLNMTFTPPSTPRHDRSGAFNILACILPWSVNATPWQTPSPDLISTRIQGIQAFPTAV
ncbi:hypothetical protein EJ04DRAFT_112527 [Polyplosphaeria fusca]|uniref:Uncharacterized protein n=1 Tax=Polyplosphaeria fusca TaxID=682080 RepID=A0A9P4V953_9PLEO|nr:hypothetical protein EJ04DRAFT_112527 [Polyplosphaeria fusca]